MRRNVFLKLRIDDVNKNQPSIDKKELTVHFLFKNLKESYISYREGGGGSESGENKYINKVQKVFKKSSV